MSETIEQTKGRVADWEIIQWDTTKQHVRRLQERVFRATRDSYRDFRGNLEGLGGIVRSMN